MWSAKLITFDVTGTLLSFRPPVFEKYLEIGAKLGLKIDPQTLKKNFNEAWLTLNEEHPNFGSNSGLGWLNWWGWFIERTFSGYIKPQESNKISEIVKILLDFYATKEAFIVEPGSTQLLEYLKTKPVQLGVISNYDPRLHAILDFMGLKNYFNFVLVSYEFGCPKPDPRIFKQALILGGCPAADKAMHVGDDLLLDYVGAKEAGWRAALISTDEKTLNHSKVQRDEVFKDFFELKEYFEKLQTK